MYALTISEPWAWAIVDLTRVSDAAKNVENRSASLPKFSGPLLIHSGKGTHYQRRWSESVEHIRMCVGYSDLAVPSFSQLAGRGIIGYVDYAATSSLAAIKEWCADAADNRVRPNVPEALTRNCYDWRLAHYWAEGPTCLLLSGVVPFDLPIPYVGRQGLFRVPDDLVADAVAEARERLAFVLERQGW